MIAAGAAAGVTGERQARAQEKTREKMERATRGRPSPKIKDVTVIAAQPARARLTVVKIVTDQDGLYGYGWLSPSAPALKCCNLWRSP
jgi:mannonate dehydratase